MRASSARNALKHGLRPSSPRLLGNEEETGFLTLAAPWREELAPAGPLQEHLAGRIALAIWRARRSDRIETELFNFYLEKDRPGEPVPDSGLLVIRDRNGARPRYPAALPRFGPEGAVPSACCAEGA